MTREGGNLSCIALGLDGGVVIGFTGSFDDELWMRVMLSMAVVRDCWLAIEIETCGSEVCTVDCARVECLYNF